MSCRETTCSLTGLFSFTLCKVTANTGQIFLSLKDEFRVLGTFLQGVQHPGHMPAALIERSWSDMGLTRSNARTFVLFAGRSIPSKSSSGEVSDSDSTISSPLNSVSLSASRLRGVFVGDSSVVAVFE